MKELLPEHARLVAEKWHERRPGWNRWYMDLTSFEQRLDYMQEVIKRFGAVGIFMNSDPSHPVSWNLRKTGEDGERGSVLI